MHQSILNIDGLYGINYSPVFVGVGQASLLSNPPAPSIKPCACTSSSGAAGDRENQVRGVGLRDLGAEDKKRLKQLIEDLALAETQREKMEERLKKERQEHKQQLSVLRSRQSSLIREKGNILTISKYTCTFSHYRIIPSLILKLHLLVITYRNWGN